MPTYLVGCGKAKRPGTHPAQDLYTGSLFRLARAYAEHGGPWHILSAKHGLLRPTDFVECYDATMGDKTLEQAHAWAGKVITQLPTSPLGVEWTFKDLVMLAGEDYAAPLRARGLVFYEPLKGLRLGERMAWLKAHTQAPLVSRGHQRNLL